MKNFLPSIGLIMVLNPLGATEPPSASPFVGPDSDKLLSLKVTAALMSDPDLAPLPVFVDVLNKVALLGGGVPNEALRDRVEATVRKVPGLREVKNGCWISPGEDPFKQLVLERLDGVPRAATMPNVPTMPKLTIVPPDPRPNLVESPALAHPGSPASKTVDRRPQVQVTVNRVPISSLGSKRLDDPLGPSLSTLIELPMPAAVTIQTPTYPTIPATSLPIKPRSLDQELRQIQQQNPNWRNLRITTSGGRVTISGPSSSPSDAWALADALRDVPGVERIIVRP